MYWTERKGKKELELKVKEQRNNNFEEGFADSEANLSRNWLVFANHNHA